jgi:Xaa-Pro dipeptidase
MPGQGEDFGGRCARAAALFRTLGADALLATDIATVRWLTGREAELGWGPQYPVSAGTAVVLGGDARGWILCPAGEEGAGPNIEGLEVATYEGYTLGELRPHENCRVVLGDLVARSLAGKGRSRGQNLGPRWAVEAHSLAAALTPGPEWVDVARPLRDLRVRKEPAEIAVLERAASVASVGQRAFRAAALPGRSEIEIFTDVRTAMEREAGTRLPLLPDLLSGPRMLLVGAPPTTRVLRPGELALCDLQPRLEGYWADSCSTLCAGRPTPEMQRLNDACRRALDAGIALARPGTVARAIDARMRSIVGDAGYTYPHHSGHGVGTNFHEEPRIVPHADRRLDECTVIALEPGGYGNGIGCRVEMIMEVTPAGGRVMTSYELGL